MKSQTIISVVVALLILVGTAFLVHSGALDLGTFRSAVTLYSFPELFLVFLAGTFQVMSQTCRLWVLAPRGTGLSWFATARAFFYGQAVNAFMPARAGDAVKVIWMSRAPGSQLPIASATGILAGDKVVDFLSFIALCLVAGGLSWGHKLNSISPSTLWTAVGVFIALIAVGFGVFRVFRERIRPYASQFLKGFQTVTRLSQGGPSFLFSLLGWSGEILALYLLVRGQHFNFEISQIVWVLAVLNIGIAVPIALANVGAFEGSVVFALSAIGVPVGPALAVATMHHVIQILVVLFWSGVAALLNVCFFKNRNGGSLPHSV